MASSTKRGAVPGVTKRLSCIEQGDRDSNPGLPVLEAGAVAAEPSPSGFLRPIPRICGGSEGLTSRDAIGGNRDFQYPLASLSVLYTQTL